MIACFHFSPKTPSEASTVAHRDPTRPPTLDRQGGEFGIARAKYTGKCLGRENHVRRPTRGSSKSCARISQKTCVSTDVSRQHLPRCAIALSKANGPLTSNFQGGTAMNGQYVGLPMPLRLPCEHGETRLSFVSGRLQSGGRIPVWAHTQTSAWRAHGMSPWCSRAIHYCSSPGQTYPGRPRIQTQGLKIDRCVIL